MEILSLLTPEAQKQSEVVAMSVAPMTDFSVEW